MRRVVIALCLATVCAAASWGRDPSTPPPLGDTADGAERGPGTNPNRAEDRYQSETRPKNDELLATAVHDSLAHDSRVNSMQVRVSAREGVVQLTGSVPRQEDRDAAEGIARQVAGVRDVDNQLVVDEKPGGPGESPIPERLRP